jgi:hypothetical protein
MRNQAAIDSVDVVIAVDREGDVVQKISSLCRAYGLIQVRNVDLEKEIKKNENRNIYILSCLKDAGEHRDVALFFSNSAGNKFNYQTFKEPFSPDEFKAFRSNFLKIINKESSN